MPGHPSRPCHLSLQNLCDPLFADLFGGCRLCSRPEDGLRCRLGIKPQLSASRKSVSCHICWLKDILKPCTGSLICVNVPFSLRRANASRTWASLPVCKKWRSVGGTRVYVHVLQVIPELLASGNLVYRVKLVPLQQCAASCWPVRVSLIIREVVAACRLRSKCAYTSLWSVHSTSSSCSST